MPARPALSLVLVVLVACSPGRIASDGEAGSDSGSGESEPIVETGDESDDDDDNPGPGPGGCFTEGSVKWLDVCVPRDPCDSKACGGELECLGGQCVEPKPAESCEGLELVDYPLPVDFDLIGPLLFANIDGIPGDELITAGEGVVEVLRAGELLVSEGLPDGYLETLQPMQLDGDEHVDLLAFSNQKDFVLALRGDGQGHFELAPAQPPASIYWPFPLDFDNDGDHDLVAISDGSMQVYRNDAGALAWLAELPVDGRIGVATDLDSDGFVDDALLTEYPSPIALLGDGAQLIVQGPLPEPPRGPLLQYGVGRPLVADLDGDGWVEVFTLLSDENGRVGGRLWWGLPDGSFAEPRDQLLEEQGWAVGVPNFVGFVELDGVAPPELLYHTQDKIGYVRPDLANRLPFGCFSLLLEWAEIRSQPVVGDLDADGQLELAFSYFGGSEVHTAIAVP